MPKEELIHYKERLSKLAKANNPDVTQIAFAASKILVSSPDLIDDTFSHLIPDLGSYNYETQVLLSEVYVLHATENHYFNPSTLGLISVVLSHWIKAFLLIYPEKIIKDTPVLEIKKQLASIDIKSRSQFESLLLELLKNKHSEILEANILDLVKKGISSGQISYAVTEKVLLSLLASTSYEIVYEACDVISSHLFVFSSCPEVELRVLMAKGGDFESLALKTLGAWGNNPIFEEVLLGNDWEIASKLSVLPNVSLNNSLVSQLVDLLVSLPVYSNYWLEGLRRAIAQGFELDKKGLKMLVMFYYDYEIISAKELIELTPHRLETSLLKYSEIDQEHLIEKRIGLLKELSTEESNNELINLLKEARHPSKTTATLEVIGELEIKEAESTVLNCFLDYPTACLNTLKHIGGAQTVRFLTELLGINKEDKLNTPSYEKEAIELLLGLVEHQDELIQYITTHDLPFYDLEHLKIGLTKTTKTFIINALCSDDADKIVFGLNKLGELGELDALPITLKLLTHTDVEIKELSWSVSENIVKRAYIYKHKTDYHINEKLWVENQLSDALIVVLSAAVNTSEIITCLEYLSKTLPSDFPVKKLASLAGNKNPHILKFYFSFLGKSTDKNAFKMHLSQYLTLEQDIYTLRQVILALTELPAASLESLMIPLLNHSNMNIKKTVVGYFNIHGSVKAVSPLVSLFRSNKNTGLREGVREALKRILGSSYLYLLLNEYSNCTLAWQKELLWEEIHAFPNFAKHANDFTSLKDSASWVTPIEKSGGFKSEILDNWIDLRQNAKDKLHLLFDDNKEIDRPELWEEILKLENKMIVKDLLYNELKSCSVEKVEELQAIISDTQSQLVFTSAEAYTYYTNAPGNNRKAYQDLFLQDAKLEGTEWQNLVTYDAKSIDAAIVSHFIFHKGLLTVLEHFVTHNKSIAAIKNCLGKEVYNLKYLPLFMAVYQSIDASKDQLKTQFQDWVLGFEASKSLEFKYQTYLSQNTDEKIKGLDLLSPQEQSILQEEIETLYLKSSWQQRNDVLKSIKQPGNHQKLFRLSFEQFLSQGKLNYWYTATLSENQLKQLETHEDAIELAKKRSHLLHHHSNSFILIYVKELSAFDRDLLSSFHQISTEKKWEIFADELASGNLQGLDFIFDYKPIIKELHELLDVLPTEGKQRIISWLMTFETHFDFPLLEDKLMSYLNEWINVVDLWKLLFKVKIRNIKKQTVIQDLFVSEYKRYSLPIRIELLELLDHYKDNYLLSGNKILTVLESVIEGEESPFLILKIKTITYSNSADLELAKSTFRKLALADPSQISKGLEIILEQSSRLGFVAQIQFLDSCYSDALLQEAVTNKIADLYASDAIILNFLSPEGRERFDSNICPWLKRNIKLFAKLSPEDQLSFIKPLLRNLAEEPTKAFKALLTEFILEPNYSSLDFLYLRLLKQMFDKPEYLAICNEVLKLRKQELLQQLIRTLSYAQHTAAIPELIDLVFHKKNEIAKAAKDGLLMMKANSSLSNQLNKLRPDKRSVLIQLLGME